MSILIAILGLALLVLVHEAGHFLVALAVKIRPRSFYIGFPFPALAKVKRKGIEYGIGAVPLGGMVRIPGMHRPAPADLDVHFGPAQYHAPELVGPVERLKRLIDAAEFAQARKELPELEAAVAAADLPLGAERAARRGLRDLDEALGADAYWRQRTWKRVAVVFAGPATNVVFAVFLFALVYMLGIPFDASRRVETVAKNTPAAASGLRPGDEIIAINYEPMLTFKQVSHTIRHSDGKPLYLKVLRPGHTAPVDLPAIQPKKLNGYWAIGFSPSGIRYKRYGAGVAIKNAGVDTWRVTTGIGSSLARIVTGSGRKDVSSAVGIVDVSSQAVKSDFRDYLQILAIISLSLALLNLLPLLPLDGGHIVFSIVEGVRGRSVGRAVYERVSAVGIALVLLLFVVGLSNDIGRLTGG